MFYISRAPRAMRLSNIILPNKDPAQRFNIECSDGELIKATEMQDRTEAPSSLVLPALCHPHIHLDKAYLLTSHSGSSGDESYPDYSDLALEQGDFKEALSKTSEAKTRYTVPDLILRGSQLIAESIESGVTSMRAFVEIDHVTHFKCLEAAVELRRKFGESCYIQICAFAQDPIMSTEHGDENRELMETALKKYKNDIEVLGSTPYVEADFEKGLENIEWAIRTAIGAGLHLDFHLDYNLDGGKKAMIWDAIRLLKDSGWNQRARGKTIVFGHCSRMTLFSDREMQELADAVADLPVAFVGLPTSDLFMMGRPDDASDGYGKRQRGTLQVVDMIQKHNLKACVGINNVGNAFTPWGSADPLRLASLGVGLYHAGTAKQAKTLYECVSTRARRAIGLQQEKFDVESDDLDLVEKNVGGLLVVKNGANVQVAGSIVPARQRLTVTGVVWDPPEKRLRNVIYGTG